jgi:hypothetical protein
MAPGPLAAAAFRSARSSRSMPDDRVLYDSATGQIRYDADGCRRRRRHPVCHGRAGTALTNADSRHLIGCRR